MRRWWQFTPANPVVAMRNNPFQKASRPSLRWLSICEGLAKIAWSLFCLLHAPAIQLGNHATQMLLVGTFFESVRLLRNLFARTPEAEAGVLRRFALVTGHSKCPFARKAKLLGVGVAPGESLRTASERLASVLLSCTQMARRYRLDGVVVELNDPRLIHSLPAFCAAFHAILRSLAEADPTGRDCFEGGVLVPDWQFSFNGTRFFITTFAPFYQRLHPRWSHSTTSAFIYLQPEDSFDHHGVHARNAHRAELKARIRQDFLRAGCHLDVALIEQPHEAYKYVKPLRIGDPPLRWWEAAEPSS